MIETPFNWKEIRELKRRDARYEEQMEFHRLKSKAQLLRDLELECIRERSVIELIKLKG